MSPSRAVFMLGIPRARYAFLLDWYYHHSWRDHRIRGSILLATRRTNRAWSAQHCLFTLVGAAFWRFGWKIGLLDLLLVFTASNVGLRLHKYLRMGSGL